MGRGSLTMVDYDAFSRRHIGPSEDQAQTMLMELGYSSMADFIADVVPKNIAMTKRLSETLPTALNEVDVIAELRALADKNDVYHNLRQNVDFLLVSDEIGKSKPATLFFLSKFGCELEKIVFYSNITINSLWDEFDILLTANPNLLLNHPTDKIVIKFNTVYNTDIDIKHNISTIKELKEIIEKL